MKLSRNLEGIKLLGRLPGALFVVDAKKEKIADYTGVIAQAGKTPVVVDVDAFALQNCYEYNYEPAPGSTARPAAPSRSCAARSTSARCSARSTKA